MVSFRSDFVHQDVLCFCAVGGSVLAGIGGSIYIYTNAQFQSSKLIFLGQKVHLIKAGCDDETRVFAVGGKYLALCRLNGSSVIEIESTIKCSDWILDAEATRVNQLVVVTSHNQAQLWNTDTKKLEAVSSPSERCILYSSKIHKRKNDIFVLSGTVFSDVIVWKPEFQALSVTPPILYSLKGHKGVIFSIAVGQSDSHPAVICTTSDDRTVRLVKSENLEDENSVVQCPPLYSHTSRVWKALLLIDHILSIGEDSLLCVWNYKGELITKILLHYGGGIHSLIRGNCTDTILTGGSDGGIFEISRNALKQSVCSLLDNAFGDMEIPRKISFLGPGIVCLTDNQLFFRKEKSGPFIEAAVEKKGQFKKCTDLATSSCGRYIGMTSACGHVLVFDTLMETGPVLTLDVGNGTRCESLSWRNDLLLVQSQEGIATLFAITQDQSSFLSLSLVTTFILPKSKERSSTCFVRLPAQFKINTTLVGDRSGNVHLFKDKEKNPMQSLFRLHTFLGVSDIFFRTDSQTVLTAGVGGWVRELGFSGENLSLLRSFSVPMESAVRILDAAHGIVIAGFHGSSLKIWNFKSRMTIAYYMCGGGHRSYDFAVEKDELNFIFIKEKQIYRVSFNIQFGRTIRSGYHTKTINCLTVLDNTGDPIVVSGGEDNTLRIVQLGDHDLDTLGVSEQHVSSVRAVCVHPLTDGRKLIVAAGGREQLTLSEFDLASRSFKEILTHSQYSASADGRYMCLASMQLPDGRILILVGCSDCTLRLFAYKDSLELIVALPYTHCILHVAIMEHFAVTFSTDGKAVFWDLAWFITDATFSNAPVTEVTLHQSGINSVFVEERTDNEFLVVTGGDDNMLSLAVLRLTRGDQTVWEMVSHWTTSEVHSCQITGLAKHLDWLVSTSIDQRVAVHRLREDGDALLAEWMDDVVVTVPDAHGLAVLTSKPDSLTVCVYGKGVEVVTILLDSSWRDLSKCPDDVCTLY